MGFSLIGGAGGGGGVAGGVGWGGGIRIEDTETFLSHWT